MRNKYFWGLLAIHSDGTEQSERNSVGEREMGCRSDQEMMGQIRSRVLMGTWISKMLYRCCSWRILWWLMKLVISCRFSEGSLQVILVTLFHAVLMCSLSTDCESSEAGLCSFPMANISLLKNGREQVSYRRDLTKHIAQIGCDYMMCACMKEQMKVCERKCPFSCG